MQEVAVGSIAKWPQRLSKVPARIPLTEGATVFEADTECWAQRVAHYKKSLGLNLGTEKVRNILDMNAFLGGFAAALLSDPVWVMNVVPAHKPRTLDVIYDRGLIGVYHDWYFFCSFRPLLIFPSTMLGTNLCWLILLNFVG